MSLSVVPKLLKRMGFKQRGKIKTNFISKKKTNPFDWPGPKNTSILRYTSGGSGCFLTKPESICEAQMVILIIGQMAVISCSLTRWNLTWREMVKVFFSGVV
jgi:hypothetical protein